MAIEKSPLLSVLLLVNGVCPVCAGDYDTVVEYSGTYGAGKTAHGKISYAQCDAIGIPRDLNFASEGTAFAIIFRRHGKGFHALVGHDGRFPGRGNR